MTRQIDVSENFGRDALLIVPEEHEDDRIARIRRKNMDHLSSLVRGWCNYVLLLLSYVGLFGICVYVLVFGNAQAGTFNVDLARLGVSTLFSGLVGLIAGQMIGSRTG
jgi:hypothetical protein